MDGKVFEQRIGKLKYYLDENNIDLAMISSPLSIFYFTGFKSNPFERFFSLVIDRKRNEDILFVPLLDFDAAKSASFVQNIVPVSDSQNPYTIVMSTTSTDTRTIGAEKKMINLFTYEQFSKLYGNPEWIDIEGFINSLKIKKTNEEVKKLQKAIHMIEKVMEAGRRVAKVGMTEIDVVAELEYQMRKVGSDGPGFSTIVLTGHRAALPHGHPGNEKLKENDFLLIDMGVTTEGYFSDTTRTFLLGEGTKEQEQIYNIVLEANRKAISAVKQGEALSTIDRAARDYIREAGYGDYFNNRVGHGIGIDVHESPSIHELNTDPVLPGMVFTIEPGIYIPNYLGVRIEDTVYVNEEGNVEVLTSYPKELIKL